MTETGEELPLFEIAWDEREVKNVIDSVTRGGYWANGPYVSEFEGRLRRYFGVEHAPVVNSGTSALVCALQACGIGNGDEVIVPSFTFIATANAVKLVGATPVFADIEPSTYGLDPDDVRTKITPETSAVIPVHVYGASCRIAELAEITDEHGIWLVEDAAEAFGAKHGGQNVGTFGDLAALSFCQNKVITTGEGGAVVTDDHGLAENVRLFRSHGRASKEYFGSVESGEYVALGSNLRMADVVASIGCAQIEKVERLVEGRRAAARRMGERLSDVEGVVPHSALDGDRHVYQIYTIEFEDETQRPRAIEALTADGIASKVYWDPPVHRTRYYRSISDPVSLPTTDSIAGRVLSLPIHPNITRAETDRICASVAAALDQ